MMRMGARATVGTAAREAWQAMRRRGGRTLLAGLGSCIGIGLLAATVGLTSYADASVTERFESLRPQRFTVTNSDESPSWLRSGTLTGLRGFYGVVDAGVIRRSDSDVDIDVVRPGTTSPVPAPVVVADAAALRAMRVTATQGRLYDSGHLARGDAVVLVGAELATSLGVNISQGPRILWLDGQPVSAIGVVTTDDTASADLRLCIVAAGGGWMAPGSKPLGREEVVVRTARGQVDSVAAHAPALLRPEAMERVVVEVPPDPTGLKSRVSGDLRMLLLAAGAVTLALGVLSISNTTLMSVVERRSEIGLRRAMGARRIDTVAQIMVEATLTGGVGGLVGGLLGAVVAVAVAATQGWPFVPQLWPPVAGLAVGAVVGAVAGAYPAMRAAQMHPADALRT